jgi:hypothetical protein
MTSRRDEAQNPHDRRRGPGTPGPDPEAPPENVVARAVNNPVIDPKTGRVLKP